MIDPASIGSVYQEGIVEAGKEPAFLFLVSFLGAFGFIRTSAHMIRAQVSWWPGNVEVGGTHIHHLVWGIIVILISGWISIAVDPGSPGKELVAIAFGIGTGLTLDEFALWLELKDVYWSEDGRKSIDAVIVAAILAGLGVLGFSVLVDLADDVERAVLAVVGFFGLSTFIFVGFVCLKGKFGMAARRPDRPPGRLGQRGAAREAGLGLGAALRRRQARSARRSGSATPTRRRRRRRAGAGPAGSWQPSRPGRPRGTPERRPRSRRRRGSPAARRGCRGSARP